jgi:hypothetical protein
LGITAYHNIRKLRPRPKIGMKFIYIYSCISSTTAIYKSCLTKANIMKKYILTVIRTFAFSGAVALANIAAAEADTLINPERQQDDRYIGDFCDPGSGECAWHATNGRNAFDAAVIDALNSGAHNQACKEAFTSYERLTDTYVGLDGSRFLCKI